MVPIHTHWSVTPWQRYDAEPPPETEPRRVPQPDGSTLLVSEPLDPSWRQSHRILGAEIHDHDRDVTYRATLGERGQLDHLEIVARGHIDEGIQRRVPIERIRRTVSEHLQAQAAAQAEHGPDTFVITPPGGLVDPTRKGEVPDAEEIADLMADHGLDRHALAARYRRPVRTVDRWITNARNMFPDRVPPATRGAAASRYQLNQLRENGKRNQG